MPEQREHNSVQSIGYGRGIFFFAIPLPSFPSRIVAIV
jgi:hypothetical protein